MAQAPTVTQTNVSNGNCSPTPTQQLVNAVGFNSYRAATGTGNTYFTETFIASAEI